MASEVLKMFEPMKKKKNAARGCRGARWPSRAEAHSGPHNLLKTKRPHGLELERLEKDALALRASVCNLLYTRVLYTTPPKKDEE